MRIGIDRQTGQVLTGWAHCAQSIAVILSTAIGTRIMRRTFGSDVPRLVDRPSNHASVVLFVGRVADALQKWEPGFVLRKVQVLALGADGQTQFSVVGTFYEDGHLGIYTNPVPVSAIYDAAGILAGVA